MIQNEVAILRRVKHPNVVLLIEELDTYNELYLVMELVKVCLYISITCSPTYIMIMINLRASEKSRTDDRDRRGTIRQCRQMTKSRRMRQRESVCFTPLRRKCVHIFYSLSGFLRQEMLVHNSGAKNVIHLFALCRGVLQNIGVSQSVGEMCACVTMSKVGGRRPVWG